MLSYETERRLKNYLAAIAEGEVQVEQLRQRLCQISDFSPCMAFQRIDRNADESISSVELYNFLRDLCICSISEGELSRIVKFFDNNNDGRLTFTEFEQILLPCEDNCLRRIAQDRRSFRVARYENLPIDIEKSIMQILEREVQIIRKLDLLKRELEVRYDFTPYAAFKAIDKCCEGSINRCNLNTFFRQNGFFPSDREITAIIRRMDTQCSQNISYGDFSDFLRIHGSSSPCASPTSTHSSGRSASAAGNRGGRSTVIETPLRPRASSSNKTSGKRTTKKACCDDCKETGGSCNETSYVSPCRPYLPVDCYSPSRPWYCRYYPYYCDPCSPCDPCRPYYCRPSTVCEPICRPVICDPICRPTMCRPCGPYLSGSNEYELVKALYDIIKEERDLEAAKINLVKRGDFNLFDAFKIFDNTSKGYITIADLREGLAAISVFPTSSDMELYIKRYDKFNERKVRFSDFSDSFTPQTDSYYSSSLNRRRSNYYTGNRYSARDDCFEAGTRVEFRSVWNTHFKVEAMCEGIRQRLRSLPCFDLYNAFLTCDLYSDGVITKDELRRFIDCKGFCVTDTDAKQLVDKMDQNKDGSVSYSEFREELQPKSFSFYRS